MSVLSALRLSGPATLGFAVLGMIWGSFAALVPAFKAQLGLGDAAFGTLLLSSFVGLMLAMWAAPAADRRFSGHVMQAGALALAALWLLPPFITAPWMFAVVMGLLGLSSGVLDVVMNARVSEREAETGRPLLNANHGVFSLSYAGAAVLSGLARQAGWPSSTVFGALFVVALAALPFLATRPQAQPARHADQPRGGLGLMIHLAGLVVLLAFMTEAAVESWSALHVERTLGGSPAQSALGPAAMGFTMAIGRFWGNTLETRLSPRAVMLGGSLLTTLGGVVAATAPTPIIAYLGFAVLGLGVSAVGPLGIALAGRSASPERRVDAVARAAVMGFAGFFFAPILMGWVSGATSLRIAFGSLSCLMLLAIPLIFRITRR